MFAGYAKPRRFGDHYHGRRCHIPGPRPTDVLDDTGHDS